MIFLKLGGSAITDKTRDSTARADVIRRVAQEIKAAQVKQPALRILIGHGSGSFGHFAAQASGFGERGNWRAYAYTGAAATRLTRILTDIFIAEELPVVALQPSASALCRDGELVRMAIEPIQIALERGLVPLVHGDVAFDETREMTIASTEKIFAYLAPRLHPTRIILAGIVDGVYTADPMQDASAQLLREITPALFPQIAARLRGSHGVDVTGGMMDKVKRMVALVEQMPALRVQIVSVGMVGQVLLEDGVREGTLIHAGK